MKTTTYAVFVSLAIFGAIFAFCRATNMPVPHSCTVQTYYNPTTNVATVECDDHN